MNFFMAVFYNRCNVEAVMRSLLLIALACGCGAGGGGPDEDVICGEPYQDLWDVADVEALEGCTHFRGSIRIGDTPLVDFESLPDLRIVDGYFILFRNNAALSVRGLESLESVGGNFGISNNGALVDLDALANLRTVGGDLYIISNHTLDHDEVYALVGGISVGGTIDISGNAPR
jgi:hypothetical protein